MHNSIKVVTNKKFENCDHLEIFLLPFDGNKTLYSHRIWEYIVKTEVKIFLEASISMVTV